MNAILFYLMNTHTYKVFQSLYYFYKIYRHEFDWMEIVELIKLVSDEECKNGS